jgi:hypothetical protein
MIPLLIAFSFLGLSRAAINEPPNGKVYFGAWYAFYLGFSMLFSK